VRDAPAHSVEHLLAARILLRDFRLGLVGVFLLLLQFAVNVPIGRRGGNFARLRAGVGSGWQPVLSRVLRKRFQPSVKHFAEMIVHFLQVAGRYQRVSAGRAIVLLGTLDDHLHVVVRVGGVAGAFDDITLTELALSAISCRDIKAAGRHKNAVLGIECRRQLVALGGSLLRGFCRGLIGSNLLFYFRPLALASPQD
jgi:hypothetical protein